MENVVSFWIGFCVFDTSVETKEIVGIFPVVRRVMGRVRFRDVDDKKVK